jgi:APA family basic amino acid/polyamine antiporter
MSSVSKAQQTPSSSKMGFWKCWAMSVGVMIGSGVFMLPAVLAPYGSASFLGWLLTSAGAIVIALVLGRLASRTERPGGTYVYTQEAFGNLPGFLIAWGYWLAIVFASAAISTAFAGYLGTFIPAISDSKWAEGAVAALLIWTLTAVNIRSVSAGATLQLITTLLKLLPLIVIMGWGVMAGDPRNIPQFNPSEQSLLGVLGATALLTMWAFVGLEACLVAADDVVDPKRTIPRAVVAGTITVTCVYIAATLAVMLLVPTDVLAASKAPFVDAAKGLGSFGAGFIAFGALIATAGSANGKLLLGGQMPMAVAIDGLGPKFLARRNEGNAPVLSLIISGVLSTLLLIFNYTEGLLAAFTFLIAMSTLCTLLPYFVAAMAEIKLSWRSARGWAIMAILAMIYAGIAMLGSGVKTLLWGALLMLAGLPVYYWGRSQND